MRLQFYKFEKNQKQMKKLLLVLLLIPLAFIAFVGCEDIFGEDKSTCQCEIELTFTDLEFSSFNTGNTADFTIVVDSGQRSCEAFFDNPPSSIDFVATNGGIAKSFSVNIDDIPEFNIKNAECVGDIIED